MTQKSILALAVSAVLATSSGMALAESSTTGPFGFEPVDASTGSADWNPAAPWKIPAGFTQAVVSDETDLNIYAGSRDDWNDMNTVNETGKYAGRYLYRAHEVRGVPEGGAVSVVDLGNRRCLHPCSGHQLDRAGRDSLDAVENGSVFRGNRRRALLRDLAE